MEREHFYGLGEYLTLTKDSIDHRSLFLITVYVAIGDEKHAGVHDPARAASRERLATGVREWLHRWGYPWSERDGVICVDSVTHL